MIDGNVLFGIFIFSEIFVSARLLEAIQQRKVALECYFFVSKNKGISVIEFQGIKVEWIYIDRPLDN